MQQCLTVKFLCCWCTPRRFGASPAPSQPPSPSATTTTTPRSSNFAPRLVLEDVNPPTRPDSSNHPSQDPNPTSESRTHVQSRAVRLPSHLDTPHTSSSTSIQPPPPHNSGQAQGFGSPRPNPRQASIPQIATSARTSHPMLPPTDEGTLPFRSSPKGSLDLSAGGAASTDFASHGRQVARGSSAKTAAESSLTDRSHAESVAPDYDAYVAGMLTGEVSSDQQAQQQQQRHSRSSGVSRALAALLHPTGQDANGEDSFYARAEADSSRNQHEVFEGMTMREDAGWVSHINFSDEQADGREHSSPEMGATDRTSQQQLHDGGAAAGGGSPLIGGQHARLRARASRTSIRSLREQRQAALPVTADAFADNDPLLLLLRSSPGHSMSSSARRSPRGDQRSSSTSSLGGMAAAAGDAPARLRQIVSLSERKGAAKAKNRLLNADLEVEMSEFSNGESVSQMSATNGETSLDEDEGHPRTKKFPIQFHHPLDHYHPRQQPAAATSKAAGWPRHITLGREDGDGRGRGAGAVRSGPSATETVVRLKSGLKKTQQLFSDGEGWSDAAPHSKPSQKRHITFGGERAEFT